MNTILFVGAWALQLKCMQVTVLKCKIYLHIDYVGKQLLMLQSGIYSSCYFYVMSKCASHPNS
jgi:hypothetical protein